MYRSRLDSFNPVSIHASVKDATTLRLEPGVAIAVSIHASVKDATSLHKENSVGIRFNPRICKRCDKSM